MPTFKIVSVAGLDLGNFEGATLVHAIAAMHRDAGYTAHVDADGTLVTDAPGDAAVLAVHVHAPGLDAH